MTHQQQTPFENIVGKGEIAPNKQFLLFSQCCLHNRIIVSPFVHVSDTISLFAAEFKEPKIGISGKGLTNPLFLLATLENTVAIGQTADKIANYLFTTLCFHVHVLVTELVKTPVIFICCILSVHVSVRGCLLKTSLLHNKVLEIFHKGNKMKCSTNNL